MLHFVEVWNKSPARNPAPDTSEVERAAQAHQTALQVTARRILGCHDAASDAVQEALITLWLSPPPSDRQRAWLVRTVVHRSLHQRRTRARRERWEREAGDVMVETCPVCSPQQTLEMQEISEVLSQALAALPAAYRTTFLLRELEGWDYERIARALEVPIGTVRSRLNRAKSALRTYVSARLSHEREPDAELDERAEPVVAVPQPSKRAAGVGAGRVAALTR